MSFYSAILNQSLYILCIFIEVFVVCMHSSPELGEHLYNY